MKLALSILSIVLIAGAQIWIANSTGPANGLQNFLWGAGVLLIVIVTAVQFFDERGDSAVLAIAEEAIAESNKARKKTEDFTLGLTTLDTRLRFISRLYQHHLAFAESVENVFANELEHAGKVSVYEKLLELLLRDKQTLFGIDGDDNWNFAIYLHSKDADDLECIVCRRANKFEEDQPHRRWKSGDGHVGLAFQNKKELVCEDTKDPNVASFFEAPPGQQRVYDPDRYRSIASVPILIAEANCVGVVVATSDKAKRFRPYRQIQPDENDSVAPVRLLAKTIALIESVSYFRSNGEQND